ncbi:MAG: hypothetical protein K2X38_12230 [Gemmataceae bacterium]|nr:hypothetical protein [Gemmataceae bacterium]
MKRIIRLALVCIFTLAIGAGPLLAQESEDTANHVSHGGDYVVAFLLMLLILFPVCKPSRPF